MKSTTSGSPVATARFAGFFYLLMIVLGGVATFFRKGLIIKGDASATSANLIAHHSAYLSGYAFDVLSVAFYIIVVALFYRLFKPSSKNVALIATFFGLAGCIIQSVAFLFELAALVPLNNAALTALNPAQVQQLSFVLLRLYTEAYSVGLPFFAFFMAFMGYAVFKSSYVPRFIGGLFMIAGFGWLPFLNPSFGQAHLPYILPFSIGELVIALWLLIKGVDVAKWNAKGGWMALHDAHPNSAL
jgi:hypothetical protein